MEAKERLFLSEDNRDASPVGMLADSGPSRVRADFEGLLQLAEKLQQSLEKGMELLRETRMVAQLGLVLLTLGIVAAVFSLVWSWPHVTINYSFLGDRGMLRFFLCLFGFFGLLGLWYLSSSLPRLNHLRRAIRQDERDLTEVVELLREIEPVAAKEEDLSALERVAIRIRLSRFGVGTSVRDEAGAISQEAREDIRSRTSKSFGG